MKNKKLLITVLCSLFCVCLLLSFGNVQTLVKANESVYTVTGDTYDEDTGELSYRKISYSTSTGGQFVSYPCKYEGKYKDDTCVSIKYKNGGVTFLPVYMEYGAGITADGSDYSSGEEIVCMDMFDNKASWNVSYSKSVDGYDVVTIIFGSYTSNYHDMALTGFRLYFDDGKTVDTTKTFEVYGLTVHERGATPSFTSDPKGCRLSKIKSDDVAVENNACVINGTATLKANILDYSTDYKKVNLNFTVNAAVNLAFKLDGEVLVQKDYGVGSHTITCNFTKDNYSLIELVIIGENCNFKINSLVLVSTPYVDTFSGSNFTVTNKNGVQTVTYSYTADWYSITAPIRKYTSDYDCLLMEFTLDTPIVMGIMIDGEYLYSHWSNTEPLAVGEHSFFFSLKGFNLNDSSSIEIYLDPPVTSDTGVAAVKTVTFTKIQFQDSLEMPKAEIQIAPLFEFDYDGNAKQASGATTNSGQTLIYEYKLTSAPESAYDTEKPVNAGEYDVRVTSELTTVYATTSVYSKLVINKVAPPKPTKDCVEINFNLSAVYYDTSLYALSLSQNFESVLNSGDSIAFGDTLYLKYIESANYSESEVINFTLNSREGEVAVSINYRLETTKENIDETCEYSTDGLNWNSGTDKRVKLDPGYIYLFRKKATTSSFAGQITYIAVPYRVQAPASIQLESTNSNSITLKAIEGVEYRLSDTVWQDSPVFEYLQANTKVTVYVRYKSTQNAYASEEVSKTFTVGVLNQEEENSSSENTQSGQNSSQNGNQGGGESVAESGCNSAIAPLFANIMATLTLFTLTFLFIKRRALK